MVAKVKGKRSLVITLMAEGHIYYLNLCTSKMNLDILYSDMFLHPVFQHVLRGKAVHQETGTKLTVWLVQEVNTCHRTHTFRCVCTGLRYHFIMLIKFHF